MLRSVFSMTSSSRISGGAGEGRPDQVGVEVAPAGADVLVRPQQVEGAGAGVVALGQKSLHVLQYRDTGRLARPHSMRLYQQRADRDGVAGEGTERLQPDRVQLPTVTEI